MSTNPSPPEPIAASPGVPLAGSARLDRMQAEVKALQQQALETQKTLEQLQTQGGGDAGAGIATEWPLVQGAWGLAAVLTAYALVQWWRGRAPGVSRAAPEAQTTYAPVTEAAHPAEAAAAQKPVAPAPAPPVAAPRMAAIEPEFADATESDWGVSHSADLDAQVAFDLQAAANEVARVRKTLAHRREVRALQRQEDARRLRELAQQAQRAAEDRPAWADSRPLPEVLDVACDFEVATAAKSSAPAPFWQRPSERAALAERSAPAPLRSTGPESQGLQLDLVLPDEEQDLDQDEGETLPSLDNAYAVKLALARESAAVDLWTEARELIDEVLETDDPVLRAQAQALLASIAQREQEAQDGG